MNYINSVEPKSDVGKNNDDWNFKTFKIDEGENGFIFYRNYTVSRPQENRGEGDTNQVFL